MPVPETASRRPTLLHELIVSCPRPLTLSGTQLSQPGSYLVLTAITQRTSHDKGGQVDPGGHGSQPGVRVVEAAGPHARLGLHDSGAAGQAAREARVPRALRPTSLEGTAQMCLSSDAVGSLR